MVVFYNSIIINSPITKSGQISTCSMLIPNSAPPYALLIISAVNLSSPAYNFWSEPTKTMPTASMTYRRICAKNSTTSIRLFRCRSKHLPLTNPDSRSSDTRNDKRNQPPIEVADLLYCFRSIPAQSTGLNCSFIVGKNYWYVFVEVRFTLHTKAGIFPSFVN